MEVRPTNDHTVTNLGDILRATSPRKKTAYVDLARDVRCWSIGELDHDIDTVAQLISDSGTKARSRIGLLAFNSAEYLIVYFALMRAGMTPVPINYRLPRQIVDFITVDADIETVFVDQEHMALLPSHIKCISIKQVLRVDPSQGDVGKRFDSVRPDNKLPCKILYTSGTTGRPKGSVLTHSGQIWAIQQSLLLAPPEPDSRVMVAAPYYHKNGLYFATFALAAGATVISQPGFDAREYLQAAASYRCDWLTGIPTMFAMLLRERDLIDELDLAHVRRISVGSAPLSESLADQIMEAFPNADLVNGYGTTEAGPIVFGDHPAGIARPLLSVGYPSPGVDCRLVGPQGHAEGTLEVKSPAIMHEYLNRPGLTRERLGDGWYDTGDVFRVDEHGFYFFVGRSDDMFVCGGENIYPAEVEKLLEQHPDVSEAAVVATADTIKGEIPIGFVVLRTPNSATPEEIRQFTLDQGAAYSHPRAIVIKDELPVGGTHKLDRRALEGEARHVATGLSRK